MLNEMHITQKDKTGVLVVVHAFEMLTGEVNEYGNMNVGVNRKIWIVVEENDSLNRHLANKKGERRKVAANAGNAIDKVRAITSLPKDDGDDEVFLNVGGRAADQPPPQSLQSSWSTIKVTSFVERVRTTRV